MSAENLEVVRRIYDRISAGRWEETEEFCDPAIAWVETASLGPDARTYRGFEETLGAVRSWTSRWKDYDFEVDRLEDSGNDVVVLARERGAGEVSGVVAERRFGLVYTLRDGLVVLVRLYGAWEEALEAAGLSGH